MPAMKLAEVEKHTNTSGLLGLLKSVDTDSTAAIARFVYDGQARLVCDDD